MLERSVLFAVLALLGTGSAAAQEFNWSGSYVGGHFSYGIDSEPDHKQTINFGQMSNAISIFERENIDTSRYSSPLGGLQAGYNFQSGRFVFGVEGDLSFGDLSKESRDDVTTNFSESNISASGASSLNAAFGTSLAAGDDVSEALKSSYHATNRLDGFGTVRARAGYAFGRYLVFATGGVIIGDMETSASQDMTVTSVSENLASVKDKIDALTKSSSGLPAKASTSDFVAGSVVGGGIEGFITPRISIKAEYLYASLPATSVTLSTVDMTKTTRFTNDLNIVTVGVNYHF